MSKNNTTIIECHLFEVENDNPKAPEFKNSTIKIQEEITLRPGDILSASIFGRKRGKALSLQKFEGEFKKPKPKTKEESSDDGIPDFIKNMDKEPEDDNVPF